MIKINKITLMHIFQFALLLTVLISLYMLIARIYDKSYRNISCWQFPMLLALLIESFII
jgi:hypothetical protein